MAQRVEHHETIEPILSSREAYEIFDAEVQRLMGMSGEEFTERWESGEYAKIADKPDNRHLMRLALMMPCDSNQPR